MAQGELAEACRVLRRAMAVEPRNIVARIELADCLVDRRRFVESSRVVETAFLLARSRGEAIGSAACLNRLVVLEVRRGKMLEARQLLQQVIRTELDACGAISALTMVNLSRVMRGTWNLQRRWRMLRGALRIAKGRDRVEALRQNGRLFIEGDDMDGALRAFEEARRVAVRVKSPPGRMASVLSDQGLALVRAGRYAAAIGVLRSASQLHAQVGNHRWAWKLAHLSQRVLNARQRVDEIAEAN
jgi:tetratricopeptide (TPR) repeat protein